MDVEIQAQNAAEIHPRWRDSIERRLVKLNGLESSFIRLHVTLIHSTHHRRGSEEVRILASLPGHTLHVHKTKADMGEAIHAGFDALEREVEAHQGHR
jgi:ribosome-associated translation inhibitor RaiA